VGQQAGCQVGGSDEGLGDGQYGGGCPGRFCCGQAGADEVGGRGRGESVVGDQFAELVGEDAEVVM
jgi:hypothetical protein